MTDTVSGPNFYYFWKKINDSHFCFCHAWWFFPAFYNWQLLKFHDFAYFFCLLKAGPALNLHVTLFCRNSFNISNHSNTFLELLWFWRTKTKQKKKKKKKTDVGIYRTVISRKTEKSCLVKSVLLNVYHS
jgi:hypothetical protein